MNPLKQNDGVFKGRPNTNDVSQPRKCPGHIFRRAHRAHRVRSQTTGPGEGGGAALAGVPASAQTGGRGLRLRNLSIIDVKAVR